jgi:hypothetical protein
MQLCIEELSKIKYEEIINKRNNSLVCVKVLSSNENKDLFQMNRNENLNKKK